MPRRSLIAFNPGRIAHFLDSILDRFIQIRIPVTITPESHDFGTIPVEGHGTAQEFTLTNNDDRMVYVQIFLEGLDADQFLLIGTSGDYRGVSAGGSINFKVNFYPTSVGLKGTELVINMDYDSSGMHPEKQFRGLLKGEGLPSYSLSLTPDGHTFPDTYVGNESAMREFRLRNTGTQAANVFVTLEGDNPDDFIFKTGGGNHTLQRNSESPVKIAFYPQSEGAKRAIVRATSPSSIAESTVEGTGKEDLPIPARVFMVKDGVDVFDASMGVDPQEHFYYETRRDLGRYLQVDVMAMNIDSDTNSTVRLDYSIFYLNEGGHNIGTTSAKKQRVGQEHRFRELPHGTYGSRILVSQPDGLASRAYMRIAVHYARGLSTETPRYMIR